MLNNLQIEQYFEDGYVIPDFQLPEKTTQAIQKRHEALLEKYPEFRDYCPAILQYDEGFADFCRNNEILDMVEQLIGPDIALWNSSFFAKPAKNGKATPWHQDAAYWIDMPDKRALSIWFAIDEATLENGCMWYTPKSHKFPLRDHYQPVGKGALQCQGTEEESIAVPLKSGSCSIHHGHTLHFSRGNSTSKNRRAFILNFRPEKMVELEREQGMDHSGIREVKT